MAYEFNFFYYNFLLFSSNIIERWKEECQTITQQSEVKFNEMKKNFENIRANNEKIYNELQNSKRKEHEVNLVI